MGNRMGCFVVAAVMAVLFCGGCYSPDPNNIEAFLKPYEADVTAQEYVLQPPDTIEVNCSKIPQLHQQTRTIRPDGVISFEQIGEVRAAGLTPAQLADSILKKASQLYTLAGDEPVDVQVTMPNSKFYYVLGTVGRPGPKRYTGRDTVVKAISDAQLVSGSWEERARVIRPAVKPGDEARVFLFNYQDVMLYGKAKNNVLLEEGDIVYMPPTPLAAVAMVIEEFVRPIGSAFSTVNIVERANGGSGGY